MPVSVGKMKVNFGGLAPPAIARHERAGPIGITNNP